MKTFFRIMALCLALVLSLSMLVSCIGGKSMDKIVEKIKDLDEDDYMYQKLSKDDREEFVEEMAEELDVDFDGDVVAIYMVMSEDGQAIVIEFEESADAKNYEKAFKEFIEDNDEDELGFDPDDFILERSGKIVIASDDEDLVEAIW